MSSTPRGSPRGRDRACVACDAEIPVKGVAAPRPAPRAAEPRPHQPAPAPAAPADVVCPRCGLHFAPPPVPHRVALRRVILVIEDMEYFRESARDALSGRYDVRCVGTVDEALEVMGTIQVDLIVIDLNLENGEESLRCCGRCRGRPSRSSPSRPRRIGDVR